MNDSNVILLLILAVLLLVAAILKIKLAEKKQSPYSTFWKIQLFVFPVCILLALGLYFTAMKNWVIFLIFFGIVEEMVCWAIRKKQP